jgi:hypothetical protein
MIETQINDVDHQENPTIKQIIVISVIIKQIIAISETIEIIGVIDTIEVTETIEATEIKGIIGIQDTKTHEDLSPNLQKNLQTLRLLVQQRGMRIGKRV